LSCRWTRDHYWIYHERPAAPILADDIERTRSLLIVTVISQTRSEPQKLAFYEVL
jgi:hypothetical protein